MNIALVIIDMQNDFVLPEAPLCVKGAQATVPTIQKLLDRARAEGWRVIHVIRQHRRDGSDVEIGRAPLFTQGAASVSPAPRAPRSSMSSRRCRTKPSCASSVSARSSRRNST
ncbi:MAG: cysteine hydrolase family protein [Bilophila wadsworthia]